MTLPRAIPILASVSNAPRTRTQNAPGIEEARLTRVRVFAAGLFVAIASRAADTFCTGMLPSPIFALLF